MPILIVPGARTCHDASRTRQEPPGPIDHDDSPPDQSPCFAEQLGSFTFRATYKAGADRE